MKARNRIINEKPTDRPVARNSDDDVAPARVKLPMKKAVSRMGPTRLSVYQFLSSGVR